MVGRSSYRKLIGLTQLRVVYLPEGAGQRNTSIALLLNCCNKGETIIIAGIPEALEAGIIPGMEHQE